MCFGKYGARNGECVESREPMTPNDAAQETHLNGAEKAVSSTETAFGKL